MSFFVTSSGSGHGGNLGGLAGAMIAGNLDELHDEDNNMISVSTGLDEHGAPVPYVSLDDDGNPIPVELQYSVEHDILTGTQ